MSGALPKLVGVVFGGVDIRGIVECFLETFGVFTSSSSSIIAFGDSATPAGGDCL